MLSRTLAAVLALAIMPAMAQAQGSVSAATTPTFSPRQHVPRKILGLRPDRVVGNVTISDSINWSGYAVTGYLFTEAKGSWVVPTVDCTTTPNTFAAFWVGIDGFRSDTVEQTGTDSDCDGTTPYYYAWYEFYPQGSYFIGWVTPGDRMSAVVSYIGSQQFTATITNETTGQTYSITSKVDGAARSSAEWVAEAPCCTTSGDILPLSNFATVSFGKDYTGVGGTNYAQDSSTFGAINAFGTGVQEMIMKQSLEVDKSVPSSLSSDGTSFTVTWESE